MLLWLNIFPVLFLYDFILLSTLKGGQNIHPVPGYINSILNNKFFTQIKAKIDKKYFYAIDNLSLKEEFIKKYLNIYTSRQFNDLYEEKVIFLEKEVQTHIS